MKTTILASTAIITTIGGALGATLSLSTEEHNLNDWTVEVVSGTGQTNVTFTETFAGAWGTFDIDIQVTSTAGMVLAGAGNNLDNTNNNITFAVGVNNVTLNPNFSLQNLTFTESKLNAAGQATDAGTLVGPWGNAAWADLSGAQSDPPFPAGSVDTTGRFFLTTLNGGNNLTSFSSNFTSGSHRFNDVKATVEICEVIPEPTSSLLVALGAAVGLVRRRR